jgi:hypothetical protein
MIVTGKIASRLTESVELALKHQDKLAGRPGCIEVVDAAFGRAIVEYLGDPEVRVDVVPTIDVVNGLMQSFAERDHDGPDVPALLDDPEITVEDVRHFADAARRFWLAEPPQAALKAGDALFGSHRRQLIPLADSAGRICARSVLPYPPGIPLLVPGERIDRERVDFLRRLMENEISISGVTQENILVLA